MTGVQIRREKMANPISEEAMRQRRDELQSRLDELSQEQTQIQRELQGISLYLDALKGVLPNPEPASASRSAPKPKRSAGGARAPRGERRNVILDMLRQEPDGYTSDKIYEMLGVTESREQKAVYATLHNMKRKGQITQNPNKHFVIASNAEEEEPQSLEALDEPETT
jgi:hypothetical protein